MRNLLVAAAALAVVASGTTAEAQPVEPTESTEPEDNNKTEGENREDFKGLKFGTGISLTIDTGSHDRVNDAELVAGVVRVKDEDNAKARILLESHYFFLPQRDFFGVSPGDWGVGPFLAIQPGENDIVSAAGLGLMIGFRRPNSSNSWNIGVGVLYDPDTKTLGDGIRPNQPLPPGETEIRYKERAQKGVVILTSFSF
jgi:hypothetical protein